MTMEIRLTQYADAGMAVLFDGVKLKIPGLSGKYDYTGKKEDQEIGLKYFGARFYDSEVGRFISLDPAKDGANWYTYCNGNPLKYVDPDGHRASPFDWFGTYMENQVDSFVYYCDLFYSNLAQGISVFVEVEKRSKNGDKVSLKASTDPDKMIAITASKGKNATVSTSVSLGREGIKFEAKGSLKDGVFKLDTKGTMSLSGKVISFDYNPKNGDYTLKVQVKSDTYVGVKMNPDEFKDWYDTFIDTDDDDSNDEK